jgi:hypothetical protein
MANTELHGIPMLRMFKAIERLEQEKKLAVSSRLSQIIGKAVTAQLLLYWRYGNLARKPVQTTKNKKRSACRCVWYYYITKKGYRRYHRLIQEFGDIPMNNSVPQRMAPGEIRKDIINSVPPEISAAASLGDIPLKPVK